MTERSGMSRRQALMYGGLAAAVPLLPAVRPDREASPSGTSPVPRQVTPARLALTVGGPGDLRAGRAGRGGTRHARCQLQFPYIRAQAGLGGDGNQTGNVISEDNHGQ